MAMPAQLRAHPRPSARLLPLSGEEVELFHRLGLSDEFAREIDDLFFATRISSGRRNGLRLGRSLCASSRRSTSMPTTRRGSEKDRPARASAAITACSVRR